MANICDVSYKIVGDKKELRALHRVLQYMERRKTPVVKTGWGKMWLGCMVTKLGGSPADMDCRGVILDFDYDSEDGVLTIDQETAWCEKTELRAFLEERFPSVTVYYKEEEPQMEGFYIKDPTGKYFPERYFLDSYEEQVYFNSIEECAAHVSEIVGYEVEPVYSALFDALDGHSTAHWNEGVYYSLHVFQVVDD